MIMNNNQKEPEAILKELTLDEKIGLIHGAQLFQTAGVERLGIPPLKMSDGPMGVRQEFFPAEWRPAGLSDDYVTYLPCNSALASTWNRECAYDIGSVLGEETRGRGKDVILGPGVNIKRSPLCGRNFEYFSEDPYLTGQLAAEYIKGVQAWDVAACVKHFAANNQETERLWRYICLHFMMLLKKAVSIQLWVLIINCMVNIAARAVSFWRKCSVKNGGLMV